MRRLLASIKRDESFGIQVRLIFEIHHDTAEVIAELLRGEKNWNSMDVKQKQSILRDDDLVGIIDGGKSDALSCILTNRLINHIKSGKITFKRSHQFRDMGALIESLPITEEEYTISPDMLNEILENKLEITAEPYPGFNFSSDSEMDDGIKRVYFQHVMDKVVERVKENNPNWFEMHKEVFFETTDYMFELTKSMKEKIKANLGLSNKVGKLLRRDGEYGTIIASKEHIYVNGMNIRALLDDFGSVILTKVIGENLRIYDLCNSIETSHRSKRVLRIIERGVTRTKDYNVGVMFKASELLMCIVYLYNMIENRGMLKNVWETPMNVHDIVLYAPV